MDKPGKNPDLMTWLLAEVIKLQPTLPTEGEGIPMLHMQEFV